MPGSGRRRRDLSQNQGIQFVRSSETFYTGPVMGNPGTPAGPSSTAPSSRRTTAMPSADGCNHSTTCSQLSYRSNVKDGVSNSTSCVIAEVPDKAKVGGKVLSSTANHLGQAGTFVKTEGKSTGVSVKGSVVTASVQKGCSKFQAVIFPKTPEAKPILTKEEYLAAWKSETDTRLGKFRKLAYEVVAMKTDRPNAKDKMHSAANKVPIRIGFNSEPVIGFKSNNSFLCHVFVDNVFVASGQGLKIKDAKTNAYEATLQTILMPHIRVVQLDPESFKLEGSKGAFTSPPPEPSPVPLSENAAKPPPPLSATGPPEKPGSSKELVSQHKESNLETACLKRRLSQQKPLEDFVIVEPLVPIPDCTPAHTLRRSADFNHMLLEYEYFFKGEATRCVVKVEDQVLADVNGVSKLAAKNLASTQALAKLKGLCWVIKTKKAVDSDTKISKEEMLYELTELNEQSDAIGYDNVGNKLLRKMGWSGGGVGKYGRGIVEPVSLPSVLNRAGLGLGDKKGITEEFKKRVKEVVESYATSSNQEDLVFDYDFRLDERQVIHDECRRLNLRSKCRGKGRKRYLCVRRKRSANELFDHIMSCGGETARYILFPPGSEIGQKSVFTFTVGAAAANSHGILGREQSLAGNNTINPTFLPNSTEQRHGNGLLPTPTEPGCLGRVPPPTSLAAKSVGNGPLGYDQRLKPGMSFGNICGPQIRGLRGVNRDGVLRKRDRFADKRLVQSCQGVDHEYLNSQNVLDMQNQWGMQQSVADGQSCGVYGQHMATGNHGVGNENFGMGNGNYGFGDWNHTDGHVDHRFRNGNCSFANGNYGFGNENYGVGKGNHGFGNENYGVGNDKHGFGNESYGMGKGNHGFGNENYGIRNFNNGFGNENYGEEYGNQDFSNQNNDVGNVNHGFHNENYGLESGNCGFGNENYGIESGNHGFGNENYSMGNGNHGFGNENYCEEYGNQDFSNQNNGVGNGNHGFGNENYGVGNVNHGFCKEKYVMGNGNHGFGNEESVVGRLPGDVGRGTVGNTVRTPGQQHDSCVSGIDFQVKLASFQGVRMPVRGRGRGMRPRSKEGGWS